MIAGILQPGYLPWLGFFEQLHRSDVFVIYDDVQYDKNGWRNRNRIKTAQGIQWLTVPVSYKFGDLVKDVRIDNKSNWRKKHLSSLKMSYAKAPFLKDQIGLFEEAYSRDWELLVDLDVFFIERIAAALGIPERKIARSSELGVGGDKIGRLVNICKHCGADVFYEGASGANYIEPAAFERHGVKVQFQDYKHPVYSQLHGAFEPYMSCVDLLFNCGPESLRVLLAGAARGDS